MELILSLILGGAIDAIAMATAISSITSPLSSSKSNSIGVVNMLLVNVDTDPDEGTVWRYEFNSIVCDMWCALKPNQRLEYPATLFCSTSSVFY